MPQESLLANDDHKLPNLLMPNLDIEGAMVVILSIQRAVADLSLLRWPCNNPICTIAEWRLARCSCGRKFTRFISVLASFELFNRPWRVSEVSVEKDS